MLPTLVLVGRPNVGKSTLFNRLTGTRDALVHDMPGMTRDRHYGRGRLGDKPYLVVDTGGLEPVATEGIMAEMARQTLQAIDEADAVIFLVDARAGLTLQDQVIADRLRRAACPVFLAVNKAEGMNPGVVTAEFHELALGTPLAISSAHGDGISDLIDVALAPFSSEEAKTEHDRFQLMKAEEQAFYLEELKERMRMAAESLNFEEAGKLRDQIRELRN